MAGRRLVGNGAPDRELPESLDLYGVELDGQVAKAARARSAQDMAAAKLLVE
ncbi:MAG TPA: hypothetical protein VKH82_02560 [Candidatus Binatia bacterium]|nr:hypothetical protein [Candidatus Binatia bacterium]